MNERPRLKDSTIFWRILGSSVMLVGGILMTIGLHQTSAHHKSPLSSALFDLGLVVGTIGTLALVPAIVLFLAHRQHRP